MNNTKIKVGIIARPNLYSVKGGDTIQIDETAKALKEFGVDVDILLDKGIVYRDYDLFHFFNIITPEDILGHVFKINVPYVVSTIYVDYRESDQKNRMDLLGILSKILPRDSIEYLKTLAKYLLKNEKVSTLRFFFKGHRASIKFILQHASILLPNSENEIKRLQKDYGVFKKYKVVPNGINTKVFSDKIDSKQERNCIICVARIEPQKNQLNVIRALKNTNFEVIFIGAPAPNHLKYYQACKSEASNKMKFVDFIPQSDLIDFYKVAKVHVLASWFETTGLSSLEAGAMGCNLVIGNRGDVKDYFEEYAFYCEPGDLDSIRNAINDAWNSDTNNKLKSKIYQQYTWEQTASITLEAYKSVLGQSANFKQINS